MAVSPIEDATKPAFVPNGGETYSSLSSSSSVHTLETNQQIAGLHIRHLRCGSYEHDTEPIIEEESAFRHSHWAVRRSQIWKAYSRVGIGDSRLSRFANCGSGLWLQRSANGDELHLSCNKCHDRWCSACQSERAGLIREKVAQHLAGRSVRMLTLTLRHSPTPLADQIKRLYQSFNNFRRRSSWKLHVTGGVAFLECKVSEKSGMWHPHLHILNEGSFWDQKEISREWHAVTGDSSIVHVRKVDSSEHAAFYVTKYVTKPADSSVFAQEVKLDELIISLRGTRLALPFGGWQHLKLTEKPTLDVAWISVGKMETLHSKAASGDSEAIRWLEAAQRRWPLFNSLFALPKPSA